jgi:hypothetical protein
VELRDTSRSQAINPRCEPPNLCRHWRHQNRELARQLTPPSGSGRRADRPLRALRDHAGALARRISRPSGDTAAHELHVGVAALPTQPGCTSIFGRGPSYGIPYRVGAAHCRAHPHKIMLSRGSPRGGRRDATPGPPRSALARRRHKQASRLCSAGWCFGGRDTKLAVVVVSPGSRLIVECYSR